MSRIDDLITRNSADGVRFSTLGEVGAFIRGNGLQKSDLIGEGTPAIHYGQIHTNYGTWTRSTKSFVAPDLAAKLRRARPGDLVIATTSEDDAAVAKATAWMGDGEAAVSGDAYIYRHSLDPRYAAYFFQSKHFQTQKAQHITGTKVKRISGNSLAKIRIPVPPIDVQREIVLILDDFTELEGQLEAHLEAEREARGSAYRFYSDQLLDRGGDSQVRWKTLGEISSRVSSGATPLAGLPKFYEGGTIPWLRTQEVRFVDVWNTEVRVTEAALRETAVKWIPANSVIVAISGATAGRSAVNMIPLTTNQHCCNFEIDPAQAYFRYVFYWIRSQYHQIKALGQGARSDLNASIIKGVRIPLPSLIEQRRIAGVLDELDAVVNDLSITLSSELAARRDQYEYYRDKLFAFEEAPA